jgi:uncharacterized protein YgiM (DUF1202 family)
MKGIGAGAGYALEASPFADGREGYVYAITGRPLVAKVYKREQINPGELKDLEKKIFYMAYHKPADVSNISWPLDALYNSKGQFGGCVMPRLPYPCKIADIYKHPQTKPLKFRIVVARNLCLMLEELHKVGYVIGDFNPNNIGVDPKTGKICLFDLDSCHINKPPYVFPCKFSYPGYSAPELLTAPAQPFSRETDYWNLGIHIFRLLMNGLTPFNGVRVWDQSPMPNPGVDDDAIRRDSYCFKRGYRSIATLMPPASTLPPEILELFNLTFITGRNYPTRRPRPYIWRFILKRYMSDLTPCAHNHLHQYYNVLGECPFCKLEGRLGTKAKSPTPTAYPKTRTLRSIVPPLGTPVRNFTRQPKPHKAMARRVIVISILLVGLGIWFMIPKKTAAEPGNNFAQASMGNALVTMDIMQKETAMAQTVPAKIQNETFETYFVGVDGLNIRSGPSDTHRVLRVIGLGENIQVSSEHKTGNWVKMKHNALTGYVNSKYITDFPVASLAYIGVDSGLNVRSGPSVNHSVIASLSQGTRIMVSREAGVNGWVRVKYNNIAGYVDSRYLRNFHHFYKVRKPE